MSTATAVRSAANASVQAELDSPEQAQRALEQAALLRSHAAGARSDGAALVQAARDALAMAERRARVLGWIADEAEPLAVEFETRARVVNHVRSFREQLPAAQAARDALETELATLTERAAGLEARLAELGGQHEALAAQLTEARAAGEVIEVAGMRTALNALEEVAADLRGQLAAVRGRMQEIGVAGNDRLLAQAHHEVEALSEQHAQGIDALGPDTPNETVLSFVIRLLGHADRCEGDAEQARHAAILAVLDGEPGFTAVMREARERRAAIERRNRGED